jgi:NAD(P)-dependent dehydrogenase (short-subunit alcohol dehydrogenase family)
MSSEGRIALVTGGGSGIGRASALRLARGGADVAVLDLNLEGARKTTGEIVALGRRSVAVAANVADSAQVRIAVEQVARELGPIDILLNNAGMSWAVTFTDMTEEDWDKLLGVNLKGAFNCTKAVVEGMTARRWGRVINISSIGALNGTGRSVGYAAAKAGLIGFTKRLGREVAPYGVTVNVVAPGFIETGMTNDWSPERLARRLADIPMGRAGLPEDIAGAVAYLAGEEAGYVTGQVISPNGGSYF